MAGDARWEATRKVVLARDDYQCLRCLGEAHHVHHRLRKGAGGTLDETIKYGLANCVSLCASCHREIHASPEISYSQGWLVRFSDDPEARPLLLANDTIVVYLKTDGTMEKYQQQTLF